MSVTALAVEPAPAPTPAAKSKSERCETCRFWQALEREMQQEAGVDIGECRNAPPAFISRLFDRQAVPVHFERTVAEDERDLYEATRFPLTDTDEWCGKFEWLPHLAPVTI